MSGIHDTPGTRAVSTGLQRRLGDRVSSWDDDRVQAYLADAVYLERKRFSAARGRLSEDDRAEAEAIEQAARAIHGDRAAHLKALTALVHRYTREIHNRFSDRTHRVATQLVPGALTRLLTASHPGELFGRDFDPASRLRVIGDGARLRRLAETHTLVLAPTHLSNLDSPILGYALHHVGLPPFIYGAGLNLFGNRLMGFFMSRLGAYTVDRRKQHRLYKDTLVDYSTAAIGRRCHSLFFPGGTRSRSGRVETRLKRGLLGTAITAWQEGLASGRPHPEVLVVPCTLSFALTLEAETLIEDALAEAGRSRYIISDDEFSEPRTVASFARKVLNLDSAVYVVLGEPMDLLGNPVDETGESVGPGGGRIDRRRYVTDRSGRVVFDAQRDRMYTGQLAERIVGAYQRDNLVQSTHIVAHAAWTALRAQHPGRDTWQLMFTSPEERRVDRTALLHRLDRILCALDERVAGGRLRVALPESGGQDRAAVLLAHAMQRFASFHSRPAVGCPDAGSLAVDPRLALYYSNRLEGYDLEASSRGRDA